MDEDHDNSDDGYYLAENEELVYVEGMVADIPGPAGPVKGNLEDAKGLLRKLLRRRVRGQSVKGFFVVDIGVFDEPDLFGYWRADSFGGEDENGK